jgi:hypothetical protein
MLDVLYESNGQFIFSSITLSKVESLAAVRRKVMQIQESESDMEDLYLSDASNTHAFVYKADGSFDFVKDFECETREQNLGSGHRELLAIKKEQQTKSNKVQGTTDLLASGEQVAHVMVFGRWRSEHTPLHYRALSIEFRLGVASRFPSF